MSVEAIWRTASGPMRLAPSQVHVWRAGLDVDTAALAAFIDTLSADELARAERFHSSVHRQRFIAAHGMLRTLLARYLSLSPGDFAFTLNSNGKPSLAPGSQATDLRFNISHSQNAALFALALGQEVGVDVEFIRPSKNESALVKRFFSPEEVRALESLTESDRPDAFFRCWTRKEAYIKARGGGLSIRLASFSVSLDVHAGRLLPIVCHDGSETERWWLHPLDPGNGFAGAVAAEGANWSVTLWDYDG